MSASDAAPLPRLGEVFFDVRGSSRSMRLSWYADTGVAVFSIWQGGMCTGTFRLAIADLPRMIDTLERGPAGQDPGIPGDAFGDVPMDADAGMQDLERLRGGEFGEYQAGEYQAGEYPEDYRRGPADYPAGPDEYPAGPDEYPAGPADPWSGPGGSRHSGASYPPRRPDASYPGPGPDASYQARRPDASYPGVGPDGSYPPRRSEAAYPRPRPGAPYPGDRPEAPYPADRPEGPYPGHQDASYPGALPGASYPPGSDPLYPGPPAGGQRSRRAADQGGRPGPADDPYLGGAGRGPADYDYPTQYGAPDDDEIAPGPPPESFPYGRSPGNRGPGGRHADPDGQFN